MWYVRILGCCRLLPFAFANIPSRFAEMSGLPHCTNRIILAIRPFATVSCPSLPLFILPLLSLHSHVPTPRNCHIVWRGSSLAIQRQEEPSARESNKFCLCLVPAVMPWADTRAHTHTHTYTRIYTLMTPRAKAWWTLQTFLSNETYKKIV